MFATTIAPSPLFSSLLISMLVIVPFLVELSQRPFIPPAIAPSSPSMVFWRLVVYRSLALEYSPALHVSKSFLTTLDGLEKSNALLTEFPPAEHPSSKKHKHAPIKPMYRP